MILPVLDEAEDVLFSIRVIPVSPVAVIVKCLLHVDDNERRVRRHLKFSASSRRCLLRGFGGVRVAGSIEVGRIHSHHSAGVYPTPVSGSYDIVRWFPAIY